MWHPHAPAANLNKLVEVETIKLQNFQQTIRLLGTIHPQHTTVLIAKSTGMLDELIPTGRKVKKGAVLAKINNPELEKNLTLSASAQKLAKSQYKRLKPLLKSGYISAKDAEQNKQTWIVAQKDLAKAKLELDDLYFYAPFDGVVGAFKKREGSQVNQGEAVVAVYDPSSLVVDFDIPCTNLKSMPDQFPVQVFGKTYTVTHMQKMLDEETHMCPADVNIRCPNCLVGATVYVDLVIAEKKNTIVIPTQAVFLKEGQAHVYTVEKGLVNLVAVETGMRQRDQIEIVKGLKSGQQVITKGQERLYPQLGVEIYQPAAKAVS